MTQDDGTDAFIVPGMKRPVPLGFIDGAGFGPTERLARAKTMKFSDVRTAAYLGAERVPYMDQDGIAAELIYASVGMGICMHRDADYKDACMWAYNRWLADMCADAPDRIFGMAQTAVLSVDAAIADFQRAKDMGLVGMMMPGDPIHEDYDHPDYDALWECATDLDLPICFHILTSRSGSLHAETRGHPLNNFLGIIRAVQDVVGLMVLGGVFERHPNLKLVVAESDAGWLPHYMYRMDHAARMNAEGGIVKGSVQAAQRVHPLQRVRHVPGRPHRLPHPRPVPLRPSAVGQRLPPHRLDVAEVASADRRAGVPPHRGAAPGDLP